MNIPYYQNSVDALLECKVIDRKLATILKMYLNCASLRKQAIVLIDSIKLTLV